MLQGGASLQFSMVPMNLLAPGATADYIDTGSWADKAVKEAKRVGTREHHRLDEGGQLHPHSRADELALTPGAAYVHITTEQHDRGHRVADACRTSATSPLVADASSDIFSRPIDVGRFGLIYAGAQKNLGPSGVTLVIIREDLLGALPPTCRRC